MLQYEQDGAQHTLDLEDYTVKLAWNGAENRLLFTLPAGHPQQLALTERTALYESSTGQPWRICKRSPGRNIDYEAEPDLPALDAGVLLNWGNGAATLGATVTAMLAGTGWTLDDQSARTDVQQIAGFYGTLLEGISEAVKLWGNDLGVQYDGARRVVHLYSPGLRPPTGAYLTEDLNLREAPQVRGKAVRGEYYNRLYLIGAEGLMLPAPHYAECRAASAPVLAHVEVDEDITDAESLAREAEARVRQAAAIQRSYTCKLADLYRLRPDEYPHLKIELYDTVILIERADYSRSYQQVAQLRLHPEHPDRNEVTLAAVPGTLSATAGRTYSAAREAASRAYSAQKAAVDAARTATDYITDSGTTVTYGRPAAAMQATSAGLAFTGIRNQRPLWTNADILRGAASPGSFAAQTLSLDLSGYSAILILYTSSVSGSWFAGAENGEMASAVLPVNGMTTTLLYPYNTLTRRNVRVSARGVQFYGGYERWQDYNLGVLKTFELDVPWQSGWTAKDSCCVPCYLYGFL